MAGGIITTGAHPKALWPGVQSFFGIKYNEFPEEWRDIFDESPSDKNYEEDVMSTGFGLAAVKAEGQSVTYTANSQKWIKRYIHVVYGLGYIVTEEELEDNLYQTLSMKRAAALAFSMRTTKEVVAANVFNRATNTSYTGGDGSVLACSTHTTDAGNQSNILSPAADISETAIEDLMIMAMTAKNNDGLQIALRGRSLHIHPNDWFDANRIMRSVLQSHNATNAVNVLKLEGSLPDGIKMNHYYTDTDQYWIKTDCPDGLKMLTRRARKFTKDNDFDTENAKAKATERYAVGWTDWRSAYLSPGA